MLEDFPWKSNEFSVERIFAPYYLSGNGHILSGTPLIVPQDPGSHYIYIEKLEHFSTIAWNEICW